jgi:hypothetical protein
METESKTQEMTDTGERQRLWLWDVEILDRDRRKEWTVEKGGQEALVRLRRNMESTCAAFI